MSTIKNIKTILSLSALLLLFLNLFNIIFKKQMCTLCSFDYLFLDYYSLSRKILYLKIILFHLQKLYIPSNREEFVKVIGHLKSGEEVSQPIGNEDSSSADVPSQMEVFILDFWHSNSKLNIWIIKLYDFFSLVNRNQRMKMKKSFLVLNLSLKMKVMIRKLKNVQKPLRIQMLIIL